MEIRCYRSVGSCFMLNNDDDDDKNRSNQTICIWFLRQQFLLFPSFLSFRTYPCAVWAMLGAALAADCAFPSVGIILAHSIFLCSLGSHKCQCWHRGGQPGLGNREKRSRYFKLQSHCIFWVLCALDGSNLLGKLLKNSMYYCPLTQTESLPVYFSPRPLPWSCLSLSAVQQISNQFSPLG